MALQDRLEAALAPALAAAGLPAAVALVTGPEGVRAEVATGTRPDAVFQIASMTKPLVSVAALALVESGQLSLDAPLGHLLPALASCPVLQGFANDQPVLRPATVPITLRHLLTHTAGFGYAFVQPEIRRLQTPSPRPGSLESLTMPLLFEPGTGWAYGVNTDWVGLAVSAASGLPLDEALARLVLTPLAMEQTGYGPGTETTFARREDGSLAAMPGFGFNRPDQEFIPGGAGLASTARDYGRFLQMLLNGGALEGVQILSPAMVAAFGKNQVGALAAGRLTTTLPWLSAGFDPAPGQRCGWGLGTAVHLQPGAQGRHAGSLSWAGITNTHFWLDPEARLGAVLMLQLLPFADPAALDVLAAFERAVYQQP